MSKGDDSRPPRRGGAFGWSLAALKDPCATCRLVFAFTMIIAGRCQDRFGPRLTATVGGLLVGAGIALGYFSATPPAMKWCQPTGTGMIAGVVLSGFGLASVCISPLAKYLPGIWGMSGAMLFSGIAFLFAATGFFTSSFVTAGTMLVAGTVLSLFMRERVRPA